MSHYLSSLFGPVLNNNLAGPTSVPKRAPKTFATGSAPLSGTTNPIALALDGDAETSYRDPRPAEALKWVQFELDAEKAELPISEIIISLNIPQ